MDIKQTSQQERKRVSIIVLAISLVIILLDQWSKIYVKTHFTLGQCHRVTDWFQIVFHENNGMAFSLEMGDKLFLSLFRIVVIGFLIYYIHSSIKKGFNKGFIVGLTMVVAGAMGNIIDCVLYGKLFSSSAGQIAEFLPEGGGYAGIFYGRVVDMLYFPLIHSQFPDWMPWVGGERFTFFSPVFNIADSFVCIGVFYLIFFEREALKVAFGEEDDKKEKVKEKGDEKGKE